MPMTVSFRWEMLFSGPTLGLAVPKAQACPVLAWPEGRARSHAPLNLMRTERRF